MSFLEYLTGLVCAIPMFAVAVGLVALWYFYIRKTKLAYLYAIVLFILLPYFAMKWGGFCWVHIQSKLF